MSEVTSEEIGRIAAKGLNHPQSLTPTEIKAVCGSALTQVEPLHDRQTLATLIEALEPFAAYIDGNMAERLPDSLVMTNGSPLARRQVLASDFKRALKAWKAAKNG